MADQSRRLCIVSRDPFRSGEFIAALEASVRPQEPLHIVVDRRRGQSLGHSDLPDRRRRPLVDLALAADGFAILPEVHAQGDRSPISQSPAEVASEALISNDDEELERLESVRSFPRRRSARRLLKLLHLRIVHLTLHQPLPIVTKLLGILIGVTLATFVLSAAGQLGKGLRGQIGAEAPSSPRRLPAAPSTTQLPSASHPSAQTGAASNLAKPTITEKPRGADILRSPTQIPTPVGTAKESTWVGGPASASATVRPNRSSPSESISVVNKLAPQAAMSKATSPRSAGSPRVEIIGEPVSVGWGKSYAVRLVNDAGQPMARADVWLVARRADGTVESIPMAALPERGTYRATLPTRPSAPINLQVRVRNGDKRVEVPVRP